MRGFLAQKPFNLIHENYKSYSMKPNWFNFSQLICLITFGLVAFSNNIYAQDCNDGFIVSNNCNQVTFTPILTNDDYRYEWRFGDDSTSTEESPSHTYFVDNSGSFTFEVMLIVSSPTCNDTTTQDVIINIPSLPDPNIAAVNRFLQLSDFINCEATNDRPEFRLRIIDASSTQGTNSNYFIDIKKSD